MKIKSSFLKQEDLDYAIECLEVCKQDHAMQYGFHHPYFTPGGITASSGGSWIPLWRCADISGSIENLRKRLF